ncbi:uncharacterized protein LOC143842569 [Paroedura picta]|uniref:uncharacterized protein LOC143842569 n=1 Tax=Paroedura picta TaxID=143630 RepID=UPI004055CF8A
MWMPSTSCFQGQKGTEYSLHGVCPGPAGRPLFRERKEARGLGRLAAAWLQLQQVEGGFLRTQQSKFYNNLHSGHAGTLKSQLPKGPYADVIFRHRMGTENISVAATSHERRPSPRQTLSLSDIFPSRCRTPPMLPPAS